MNRLWRVALAALFLVAGLPVLGATEVAAAPPAPTQAVPIAADGVCMPYPPLVAVSTCSDEAAVFLWNTKDPVFWQMAFVAFQELFGPGWADGQYGCSYPYYPELGHTISQGEHPAYGACVQRVENEAIRQAALYQVARFDNMSPDQIAALCGIISYAPGCPEPGEALFEAAPPAEQVFTGGYSALNETIGVTPTPTIPPSSSPLAKGSAFSMVVHDDGMSSSARTVVRLHWDPTAVSKAYVDLVMYKTAAPSGAMFLRAYYSGRSNYANSAILSVPYTASGNYLVSLRYQTDITGQIQVRLGLNSTFTTTSQTSALNHNAIPQGGSMRHAPSAAGSYPTSPGQSGQTAAYLQWWHASGGLITDSVIADQVAALGAVTMPAPYESPFPDPRIDVPPHSLPDPAAPPVEAPDPTLAPSPTYAPSPAPDPGAAPTQGTQEGLFENLGSLIGGAFNWLGDIFGKWIRWLAEHLTQLFTWLGNHLSALFNALYELIRWMAQLLGDGLVALGDLLANILYLILEAVKTAGATLLDIARLLGNLAWRIGEEIANAFEALLVPESSLAFPALPVCEATFPCNWVEEGADATGGLGSMLAGGGGCITPSLGWSEFRASFPPPSGCSVASGSVELGSGAAEAGDLFGFRVAVRMAALVAFSIWFVQVVVGMTPWATRENYRFNPEQQTLF